MASRCFLDSQGYRRNAVFELNPELYLSSPLSPRLKNKERKLKSEDSIETRSFFVLPFSFFSLSPYAPFGLRSS